MKTVYVLRHAKSAWDQTDLADHERPLNRRGREACESLASHVRRHHVEPALVLCSTARRARQTLDELTRHLGRQWPAEYRDDLYLAEARHMLAILRGLPDGQPSVMLVGHNPGMAELAEQLCRRPERQRLEALGAKFPTGALATFVFEVARWRDVAPGQGRLDSYVTPKSLAG
ncbi:MAG: histidine phosphatase family protein [Alphaproteobacteria bacterium]|nr:histidine phosphatase family protein [Alphaproteobacteria bacterium]